MGGREVNRLVYERWTSDRGVFANIGCEHVINKVWKDPEYQEEKAL